jgi:FlaA1/EpsC-like NDP-sugar epimerase
MQSVLCFAVLMRGLSQSLCCCWPKACYEYAKLKWHIIIVTVAIGSQGCCFCCCAAVGEVLRGDRIENSLYQIHMRMDKQCKVLCRIESLSEAQADAFIAKVDDDYKVNM